MPPLTSRPEIAEGIAAPAHFTHETIPAAPFELTAYERIARPGQPAMLYIEGDGQAWLDRSTPSMDPTPTDPVALRLAAEDPAPNVIYLARPCQYTKMADGAACPQKYWTDARLAPEIIESMGAAMDRLKDDTHITGFNLVGFSGGGGAAVLLAARRRGDVLSVRTVAGNLNHALFSETHHIDPMTGSIDPAGAAPAIATLPQIHFAGEEDSVVPPVIAQSFARAASNPPCTQIRIVPGASHNNSWAALWPELLKIPLPCGHQ
jgi:pimeloyl-ACP methyl ester carboxylesterase